MTNTVNISKLTRISYLLGAGASFHALPIVSQIPERYENFVGSVLNLIRTHFGKEPLKNPENASEEQQPDPIFMASLFASYLQKFRPGINSHSSVDTYAKKLYLTKDDELEYYKFCLSAFLAYEQIVRGPDKRYDTFFASILGEDVHDFPHGLNILSWNYDTQLEIAYSKYSRDERMHAARDSLRVITKLSKSNFGNFMDEFCVVKLNGSIGSTGRDGNFMTYLHDHCYGECKEFDFDDLQVIISSFKNLVTSRQVMPLMSFAWENESDSGNSVVGFARSLVEQTEVLVVIGYSFPFFNRKVDGAIFKTMYGLKKVYVQDPYGEDLVQTVQDLCAANSMSRNPEIIPYHNVNQFLIPRELV